MMASCTREIWVVRDSMEAAWVVMVREGVAVAIMRLGSRAVNDTNVGCLHNIDM